MSRIELVASCILYRKQWADTAFWRTQIWWTTCRSCRFWWVEPPTLWQTWPLMAPCALESLGIAWNVGDFGGCEKACSDCSAAKSRSSDFMCATVKTCQDIIYWVLCSHLTVIRLVVGRLPLSVGEWPCPFVGEHTYSRKVRCVISLGGSSSMVLCLLRFNIIVVFYMSWTSSLIEPSVAVVFFRSAWQLHGFSECSKYFHLTSPKWPSIWISSDIILSFSSLHYLHLLWVHDMSLSELECTIMHICPPQMVPWCALARQETQLV